ncbi:MAG: hypothetical protein WCN85_10870, partial [Burkholderiales bacterium]
MRHLSSIRALALSTLLASACYGTALAQPAGAPSAPWPRATQLSGGAAMLVYQPQVDAWDGNQMQLRAAVSVKPAGSQAQVFGVVLATARTAVDRAARTVLMNDVEVTKIDFPSLPDRGAAYGAELKTKAIGSVRTLSLDKVEASLKATGVKAPSFPVQNNPPRIIASTSPAILVPIDGPAAIRPLPDDTRFKRVINTRALILQSGGGDTFFLHVYDGWLTAQTLDGPWQVARSTPLGIDSVAKKLAASGLVDLLDGGPTANPKPALARGVPTIYTSSVPTELIVFKGQPNYVPVAGTLLWATNTGADVFIDSASNNTYLLLSGRWFRSVGMNGPWTFVASNALPPDFARIPTSSPAGIVLASVAGTPQAQEAVIANSIPQTATVPLRGGPGFMPSFDGAPQFQPIVGTPLLAATNGSVPVIQVNPRAYYAVSSGVWFTAESIGGPWMVAVTIPEVIYTIPTSSMMHFVTYVRVYGATPEVVYVGYTPGYLGTVVEPYGTVVYGTGYIYPTYVSTVWYPPPYTYGMAAVPVYNPALGFTFGFATGLATAAWVTPYYGAAYHPYACCGSATASVYGQYGNTAYSGTKTAYSGGGVAGVSNSGTYTNKATGTTGTYDTNRSYNANTGVASQDRSATANTVAGGTGSASSDRSYNTTTGVASQDRTGSATSAAGGTASGTADRSYNTTTGQRTGSSDFSGTSANGSSVEHSGSTTAGPQGYSHTGSTDTYNAKTGQTKS